MAKTRSKKRPWRERVRRAVRELRGEERKLPPKGTPDFFDYMEEEPVIEI